MAEKKKQITPRNIGRPRKEYDDRVTVQTYAALKEALFGFGQIQPIAQDLTWVVNMALMEYIQRHQITIPDAPEALRRSLAQIT